MKKLAFIGLGAMGFPMAGHLSQGGHQVCVYNRSPAKASLWCQKYSGRQAATIAEAVREAEMVFTCVGGDPDLRAVGLGDSGILANMPAGALLVDHTTASAKVAQELNSEAQARGLHFLDAPVSGGQAGAEQGILSVMLGGEDEQFQRAAPIIACYARKYELMGAVGSGQLAKMVNQICIAGLVQALAEGLNFARAAGLDSDKLLSVIGSGAAQSWQMDNRARTMLEGEFDFGFAVDWMRKDLAIVLDQAQSLGTSLPVTALVDQLYAEVQAMGGNRWDTSSLIARLSKKQP